MKVEQVDRDAAEWKYAAQIIMRWPRLGVCEPREALAIVAAIRTRFLQPADGVNDPADNGE